MNNQTPREILSTFYKENNLGADGGQSSSSVKIEVSKKFHFYFPNFNARRQAVLKHDIHHLLTQYQTTLADESAISAWEIGSGCKKYWAAFLINMSGVMLGLLVNFKGVLKAFARGRRTKNLYHDELMNEQALDMKIGDLRKHLRLDIHPKDVKPTFGDVVLFLFLVLFGAVHSIISLVFLPFIIFYSIYIAFKEKK